MSPSSASSGASSDTAPTVILTGASNHQDWVLPTRLLLQGQNVGHVLETCPFEGDEHLDPLSNKPLHAEPDDTPGIKEKIKRLEALRQANNKAFSLVTRAITPTLVRQYMDTGGHECPHCILAYFAETFSLQQRRQDPASVTKRMNDLHLLWVDGQSYHDFIRYYDEAARVYEISHETQLTDSLHYTYMKNALPDHFQPQIMIWRQRDHYIARTKFRNLLEDHWIRLQSIPVPSEPQGSALAAFQQVYQKG